MPGGDRTGPMGLGPMTGRAAGYCAGYPVPGFVNPIPGRGRGRGYYPYGYPYAGVMPYAPSWPFGFGRGFGRGRGRGRWFFGLIPQMNYLWQAGQIPPVAQPNYPPVSGFPTSNPYGDSQITPEQELESLKGQTEILEDELDGMKKRIEEIESNKK